MHEVLSVIPGSTKLTMALQTYNPSTVTVGLSISKDRNQVSVGLLWSEGASVRKTKCDPKKAVCSTKALHFLIRSKKMSDV